MTKKQTISFRLDEKTREALTVIIDYMTEQSLTEVSISDAIRWSVDAQSRSVKRAKGEDVFQVTPVQ